MEPGGAHGVGRRPGEPAEWAALGPRRPWREARRLAVNQGQRGAGRGGASACSWPRGAAPRRLGQLGTALAAAGCAAGRGGDGAGARAAAAGGPGERGGSAELPAGAGPETAGAAGGAEAGRRAAPGGALWAGGSARDAPRLGEGHEDSKRLGCLKALKGEEKRLRRCKETWQALGVGRVGAGGGDFKGKRHVRGIQGECEGAFPKFCRAVLGVGVGSEVGENEGSEQNPWMSRRVMSDELREMEILGKTCCGDGDWF